MSNGILENEAMSLLMSNISEKQNISNNSNTVSKKDSTNEKKYCIAAVKYTTIGEAFKDIQNNVKVYLVKEEKNGNTKTYAYCRCSKTLQDGKEICHLHLRMINFNKDGLKIFDRDILPKNQHDKSRYLADVNDDFFENMGKRGAKKKNGANNFIFPEPDHPVLLIMSHKNPKLANQLTVYASQLLKNNTNIISKDFISNEKISKKSSSVNVEPSVSDVINLITSDEKEKSNLKNNKISSKKIEYQKKEKDQNQDNSNSSEEDEDEDEDEDDDEGVSCIPIHTTKGKQLWLNADNNIIYEPEGEDGGEEIGVLKKISSQYHTILYETEYYTVIKEIKDKKRGMINCCVLTNSLFDKKMNLIGNRKKLKNKEYSFEFSDEI
jgi:hypothetical protein